MAKVTWLPNPIPTPPPDVLNLALTAGEASVLFSVVGVILGHDSGPRGKTSNVFWALKNAGVAKADIYVTGDLRLEAK